MAKRQVHEDDEVTKNEQGPRSEVLEDRETPPVDSPVGTGDVSQPVPNPAGAPGRPEQADFERAARMTPQGREVHQERSPYVVAAPTRAARDPLSALGQPVPEPLPDPGGVSTAERERYMRRDAYRREVAERLKNLVVVLFSAAYKIYNRGDVAGLTPAEAAVAISQGFAERLDGAQPSAGALDAGESLEQRDATRTKIGHLRRYLHQFPKGETGWWEDNGKPSRARLEQLFGAPVSDDERDAAWEANRGEAESRRKDLREAAAGSNPA